MFCVCWHVILSLNKMLEIFLWAFLGKTISTPFFSKLQLLNDYNITHTAMVHNPFKPEFTIVIFIHYKPQIAVAILDL